MKWVNGVKKGSVQLIAGCTEDTWNCKVERSAKVRRSCCAADPCKSRARQRITASLDKATLEPRCLYFSFYVFLRGLARLHYILQKILFGDGCIPFVTTLPRNVNRDMVLEYLSSVLPPPYLKCTIRIMLNGNELHNRHVSRNEGMNLD